MKKVSRAVILTGLIFAFVQSANATPITLNFTAAEFIIGTGSAAPPQDTVSGTFVWHAASVDAFIDSLISVSMTIDGHDYTFGELGFHSPFGGNSDLIGKVNEVNSVTMGTDDFWILWDRDSLTGVEFAYTSDSSAIFHDTFWQTFTFTEFSITDGSISVPEPATLALLGIGLAGIGFTRRRTKASYVNRQNPP